MDLLRIRPSRRTCGFAMLLGMQRLTWLAMGMLCATAAAQQPPSPVSVGIVFDTSGSMGAKLGRSRQLAAQFLRTANPQDEFFLIEFNDHPVLAMAFTADTEKIQDHLVFTQSKGRSALWDAVYLALNEIKKGQNPRKALLVISDGGDNSSHYTESEMNNLVRETGVPIYAFGVHEPAAWRGRTAEELDGPARLNEIAKQSGGRYFTVENINDIPIFAATVTGDVRSAAPRIVP
jgi:Ca-activated chloride channel family protein